MLNEKVEKVAIKFESNGQPAFPLNPSKKGFCPEMLYFFLTGNTHSTTQAIIDG